MEDNKYYVPELDDIHTGLEYEYLNSKGEWIKSDDFSNEYDYECNPHYEIEKGIDNKKIRVKYLDRDDIEEEGFIKNMESPMKLWTMKGYEEFDDCMYFKGERTPGAVGIIRLDHKDGIVSIYKRINENEALTTLFRGKIKNKSELKRIIKMISI